MVSLRHVPMLGEMRMESNIRIEDKPCHCIDQGGFVCAKCDDAELLHAIEFAKSRNRVDADGNVRIGIADFQVSLNVTDETL